MIQRAANEAPLWAVGRFGRLIEVDGRKVRAGGTVTLTAMMGSGQAMSVDPKDLDRLAREWLDFRATSEAGRLRVRCSTMAAWLGGQCEREQDHAGAHQYTIEW